jgi:lysophospholipase L1-like esterase
VGAAFAVAILPFMYDLKEDNPFLPIHRLIQEYCIHHDIPVTDLFPVFKGQKYADLWVHESDPHPNEKGHELIARGLFDFIISKQLL